MLACFVLGVSQTPLAQNATAAEDRPSRKHFLAGHQAMKSGDYVTAIDEFEKIKGLAVEEKFAAQSLLEMAYAYYKNLKFSAAYAMADAYIHRYPRHRSVDYAYYLRALAVFQQAVMMGTGGREWRAGLHRAYMLFNEILDRFPATRYRETAEQYLRYLRQYVAEDAPMLVQRERAMREALAAARQGESQAGRDAQGEATALSAANAP